MQLDLLTARASAASRPEPVAEVSRRLDMLASAVITPGEDSPPRELREACDHLRRASRMVAAGALAEARWFLRSRVRGQCWAVREHSERRKGHRFLRSDAEARERARALADVFLVALREVRALGQAPLSVKSLLVRHDDAASKGVATLAIYELETQNVAWPHLTDWISVRIERQFNGHLWLDAYVSFPDGTRAQWRLTRRLRDVNEGLRLGNRFASIALAAVKATTEVL